MQTLLDLIPSSRDGRFSGEPPGSTFFVGLDLGQRQDHSALAIVERVVIATGEKDAVTWQYRTRVELRLRHVSTWALGTSYRRVVRDVVSRLARPPLADRCVLAVDATGAGAPVVESLVEAKPACRRLIPVVITGSGQAHWLDGRLAVPRQDLVSSLQLLLEHRRLLISARTAQAAAFRTQLTNFGQPGEHDDMVFAAALAVYLIARKR